MALERPVWRDRTLPGHFLEWRADFVPGGPSFTPLDFLDQQEAVPFMLCAAWLFCPETVEYRGGVFWTERFSPENVDEWLRTTQGALSRVEAVVNHLHVYDLFGNADLDPYGEDELMRFATAVGECWQSVLTRRFPDRDVIVEVSGEADGEYGPTITFWTAPPP